MRARSGRAAPHFATPCEVDDAARGCVRRFARRTRSAWSTLSLGDQLVTDRTQSRSSSNPSSTAASAAPSSPRFGVWTHESATSWSTASAKPERRSPSDDRAALRHLARARAPNRMPGEAQAEAERDRGGDAHLVEWSAATGPEAAPRGEPTCSSRGRSWSAQAEASAAADRSGVRSPTHSKMSLITRSRSSSFSRS